MRTDKPVLLIEDDTIDVMAVSRAFRKLKINNKLIIVNNGEEAVKYLQNPENEKPGLILLDLNMPKMNGFEFLNHIKNEEQLKAIPVIVLTTSKDEEDILESYELGASTYITKSVDFDEFLETLRTIDEYWTISEIPEES